MHKTNTLYSDPFHGTKVVCLRWLGLDRSAGTGSETVSVVQGACVGGSAEVSGLFSIHRVAESIFNPISFPAQLHPNIMPDLELWPHSGESNLTF